MSGPGTGMSGGGTGLMSGGGLSMGSGGRGKSGFDGCSIMSISRARGSPDVRAALVAQAFRPAPPAAGSPEGLRYTSSPIARISASALLCSTTPGRIR